MPDDVVVGESLVVVAGEARHDDRLFVDRLAADRTVPVVIPGAAIGPDQRVDPTIGRIAGGIPNLDPERRAAAVEVIEPGGGDPFAPPPGRPEQFNAFLVRFENETPFDVSFQPGNVVLITDRNEQQFPIDGTDIYLQAERARLPDPQGVMNKTAALIFEVNRIHANGQGLTGFTTATGTYAVDDATAALNSSDAGQTTRTVRAR